MNESNAFNPCASSTSTTGWCFANFTNRCPDASASQACGRCEPGSSSTGTTGGNRCAIIPAPARKAATRCRCCAHGTWPTSRSCTPMRALRWRATRSRRRCPSPGCRATTTSRSIRPGTSWPPTGKTPWPASPPATTSSYRPPTPTSPRIRTPPGRSPGPTPATPRARVRRRAMRSRTERR